MAGVTKRIFQFSTFKHPGCCVCVPGRPEINDIEVFVEQDCDVVSEADLSQTHTIWGSVRVFGTLHGWKNHYATDQVALPQPFDVEVKAYDPLSEKNYLMVVSGVIVTYTTTGEFSARSIRPWHDMNTQESLLISWKYDTLSPRTVPEEALDKISLWVTSGKHKVEAREKKNPALKTLGRIRCERCETDQAMLLATCRCESCGHSLPVHFEDGER
jgi:hypothetical protein